MTDFFPAFSILGGLICQFESYVNFTEKSINCIQPDLERRKYAIGESLKELFKKHENHTLFFTTDHGFANTIYLIYVARQVKSKIYLK